MSIRQRFNNFVGRVKTFGLKTFPEYWQTASGFARSFVKHATVAHSALDDANKRFQESPDVSPSIKKTASRISDFSAVTTARLRHAGAKLEELNKVLFPVGV